MDQLSFRAFADAIQTKFDSLTKEHKKVFTVQVDVDVMFNTYLNAFPAEVNTIFRERKQYDCQCCRSFIKRIGHVVKVENNKIVDTIWDVEVEGYYQLVADAMSAFIRSHNVKSKFLIQENKIGTLSNVDSKNSNIVWQHFQVTPNSKFVVPRNINEVFGKYDTTVSVFKRAMEELNLESAEIVLDLIQQNQIYRGNEYKHFVEFFITQKKLYDALATNEEKRIFCMVTANEHGDALCRLRNTAIGTLLVDLSEGEELEKAVIAFESKVDSTNYRRTTAIVTPKMIEDAKQKIIELGYEQSLNRKMMSVSEIKVTDTLWVGQVTQSLDVFQDIAKEQTERKVREESKKLKTEKIAIAQFLADVLPGKTAMSIMLDPKLKNHLVTLSNATSQDSKNMFKWDNDVSWSYNGDVTDRIKERVKECGGDVDGDLRISLMWHNSDDLDLHCEFGSNEVYFGAKQGIKGLYLDIDANGGRVTDPVSPVENIICKDKHNLSKGEYKFYVNQFNKRNTHSVGFTIQVEFDGIIQNFTYNGSLSKKIHCFTVKYNNGEFTITDVNNVLVQGTSTSKSELWGLATHTFVDVTHAMLSPNFWNGNSVGNKHFIFIIDGCHNDEPARSIYSEYLNAELYEHRKTFELLGEKLKVEPIQNQASGLGFSETSKSSFVARVTDNAGKHKFYTVEV